MDANHFDTLTKVLSAGDSRRRLLAGLAGVPLLGGLLGILDADEVEAGGGRRKRRKKRHKHGKGRRRANRRGKKKPGCTPDSLAQTCGGQCGSVTNNCGQSVDCGSCKCATNCGTCETCNPQTGACVPDPARLGQVCGAPGQVCQADGTCWCDDTSCPVCRSCHRTGVCTNPCRSAGCCDGVTCQPGLDKLACGNGGIACVVCEDNEECVQNEENEYVCTCEPECTGKVCGDADGCGGTCTGGCGDGLVCADGRCIADQGTCATGDSTCEFVNGEPIFCNDPASCQCQQSIEGQTVCLNNASLLSECGDCGSSAECAELYPGIPGVVCVATSGTTCCSGESRGFCLAPCNHIFA